MQLFVALILFAFSVSPLLAQSQRPLPDAMVHRFCHASPITSGAEFDEVAAITQRLIPTSRHIHIVLANNPLINAWEEDLTADASLICIPVGLVRFMGDAEGELAFILGHEIGHATDAHCSTPEGRSRVAEHSSGMGAAFAVLFGHSSGDEAGDQRACETRADELGFNLMTSAGYNPADAARALQRLSTKPGFSSSAPPVFARLVALGKDHPITADRIRRIRKLIAQQAAHSNSD